MGQCASREQNVSCGPLPTAVKTSLSHFSCRCDTSVGDTIYYPPASSSSSFDGVDGEVILSERGRRVKQEQIVLSECKRQVKQVPKVNKLSHKGSRAFSLQCNGFTLEQLLRFYDKYYKNGQIKRGTTTNDVVRGIIIPETARPPRCYMDSDFMRSLGGRHTAQKFVSHAWQAEFAGTVLNIVLDASERLVSAQLMQALYDNGALQADVLLRALPTAVRRKTYWLCVFAINQHHSICGDCLYCNKKIAWQQSPVEHLKAESCLICERPKRHPCACGSIKYSPDDPDYEIDMYDQMISQMEALVVSLDADLDSFKRIWVAAEIGKALPIRTVVFRFGTGLSKESVSRVTTGEDLLPSVQLCNATIPEDKERILSDIRQMEGGVPAYDQFINCVCEASFGIFCRLLRLQGVAGQAAANLQQLSIDCTWQKESLLALPGSIPFKNLRELSLDCQGCTKLVYIDEFGKGLAQCGPLSCVTFNLESCTALISIDEIGKGLGKCQTLRAASFNFGGCSALETIEEFGRGLGQCQALTSTSFDFRKCIALVSIDGFGEGLGQCRALSSAKFSFNHCSALASIDDFGEGLSHCQSLSSATFNFRSCSALVSIDKFEKAVYQCQALASVKLFADGGQHTCATSTELAALDMEDKIQTASFNVAAAAGRISVIDALIAARADCNLADEESSTPLHMAVQNGHNSVLQCLVSARVDVGQRTDDGASPIFLAARKGHSSVVRALVAVKASVAQANRHGRTPLYVACGNGHLSSVQELVAARAELDVADNLGVTPLIIAAEKGHSAVVQAMIAAGASSNLASSNGATPLKMAAQEGHQIVVEELLAAHAACDLANKVGVTPLHVAASFAHDMVVQKLIAAAASVDLRENTHGATSLNLAADKGHEIVVRALIAAQADMDLVDMWGETALTSAKRNGNATLVKVLQLAKAERKDRNTAAEKSAIQKQADHGGPVLKRLRGEPGECIKYDIEACVIRFLTFATVGAPDLLSTSGVLYYEVEVVERKSGVPQFGFALKNFPVGIDRSIDEGVGDKEDSWGVDGSRRSRWHRGETEWPCTWKNGDVIGFAANIGAGKIAVSKNGDWNLWPNGVVFEDAKIKKGVFPALSGEGYSARYNLDGANHGRFKHAPPPKEIWKQKTR